METFQKTGQLIIWKELDLLVVYDFSVDYDPIAVDDIKDIYKYVMKKNNMIWYMSKNNIYKSTYKKCLYLLKKIFYIGSLFLSILVSTTSLSCISMKTQECKVRPEIINVKSNGPIFYPFNIKTSKCSGSCKWPICKNMYSWCYKRKI